VIELSKLPAEGLRQEGLVGHVQIDENEALRNLQWQVFLQPSDEKDVFFDIVASAIYEGNCSRCLLPTDRPVELRAQFLGSLDPELVARGSYTIGSQDLDVVYLPEEAVDEEALVKEQFILQRPMQLLCIDGCLGLCPQCGKNWNKGPCHCCPDYFVERGALAKAFGGVKLEL
jgi:uncharacterized protein